MKPHEIKLRIVNYCNNTIDRYIPTNMSVIDKLKNATAKFWIEQNISHLDCILNSFADVNGEICIERMKDIYGEVLFKDGECRINVIDLLSSFGGINMDIIGKILPGMNSILVFTREDLNAIFDR